MPHSLRFLRAGARNLALLTALVGALAWQPAQALRIKEVAAVQGVRSNQLSGYGLVVGLDGTGDQTTQMPYTTQSVQNYLQQMGITLPGNINARNIQLKNVAAVIVTAELPAFAQPGQQIDVVVSSMGNAKSLKGGTLITTPLRGADGEIYALAQGNMVVGGAGASQGGSKVQINHLSAGRIPMGAQVERAVPTPLNDSDTIRLGLNAFDFQTATKVVQAINSRHGYSAAAYLADLFWPPVNPDSGSSTAVSKFNALGGDAYFGWYASQHVGVENPAFIRRQYGLAPYRAGFSCHYNYAHHLNGYNDVRGDTYKSMNFVYGDGNGVLDTLAWEAFREGMDDIRYATCLQQLAHPLVKAPALEARYAAKKALQLLADMNTDAFDLTTARLEMIRHILTLQTFSH